MQTGGSGWRQTETDSIRFSLRNEKDLDTRSHSENCEVRMNLRNGLE